MVLRDGQCVDAGAAPDAGADPAAAATAADDSGCLVATAAYGTELAPQVQALREVRDGTLLSTRAGPVSHSGPRGGARVRDGTLLSTRAGSGFMEAFGAAYCAFLPPVADLEREVPALRQAAALALAPMLHALRVVALADPRSEARVVAYGAAAIALVVGMYAAAPAAAVAVVVRRTAARDSARTGRFL